MTDNRTFFMIKGALLLLLLSMTSLLMGRYEVSLESLGSWLFSRQELPRMTGIVLFHVRLPRILAALFTGAALSGAGALFQTVFRNPMVSPSVMGASSGAAFGAALGILLEMPRWMTQASSFVTGAMAVSAAIGIAAFSHKRSRVLVLVLSGMLVSTFFTSLISLVKFTADPQNTLPSITYWLMGSLSGTDLKGSLSTGIVVIVTSLFIYGMRWKITALSLDDEEAASLGINPRYYRSAVILCAALMTSAAVSLSGVIGWIGLVVPHMIRLITGVKRFGDLFLYSLLGGAVYLLVIDTGVRTLTPIELPLGIVTSLIGAPFFAFFILRKRTGAR